MIKLITSICPRCKKQRILSKAWEETISTVYGSSTITHKLMVCPDPKCQKYVDAEITANKDRLLTLIHEKEERLLALKKK